MTVTQTKPDVFSTEHLHADLAHRSVRGGLITLTSQGTQFLLQSVSTVVLARLLLPKDFGLVAMVTAITGLGQAFADLGLSEATIQDAQIGHEQVSTLFWVNVGLGCMLMLLTMTLAPVLAWFYHEPRLLHITLLVSITFLIGGLRVQHDALLRRQMRYTSLAIRDILAYAIAVPVAIILAMRGAGYWAIVALPLTLNFLGMLLSWMLVRWTPGLPRRGVGVKRLITFGGNVASSYVVMNLTGNADNVLIGWFCGATPLGLYSRACNLLMLPVRQLAVPGGSIAVSGFSRIQDEPELLARYYLRAANIMIWMIAPVFGYLVVVAEPVITLVLGPQWREAAPVFQLLAIFALGQLIKELTVWFMVSRGQSRRLLSIILITSPIIIASYALGLPFGIRGVALFGSSVMLATLPWILKTAFRDSHLTLLRLGRAIVFPVCSSLLAAAVSEVVLRIFHPVASVAQMLVAGGGFAATCSVLLILPQIRAELELLASLLRRSITAKFSQPIVES